jgi:hypothetical protein
MTAASRAPWGEGFARLGPSRPPADVPRRRWETFIYNIGRVLDGPFYAAAIWLGWGSFDLFGCDRDRSARTSGQRAPAWY